jgi:hypothetical protein
MDFHTYSKNVLWDWICIAFNNTEKYILSIDLMHNDVLLRCATTTTSMLYGSCNRIVVVTQRNKTSFCTRCICSRNLGLHNRKSTFLINYLVFRLARRSIGNMLFKQVTEKLFTLESNATSNNIFSIYLTWYEIMPTYRHCFIDYCFSWRVCESAYSFATSLFWWSFGWVGSVEWRHYIILSPWSWPDRHSKYRWFKEVGELFIMSNAVYTNGPATIGPTTSDGLVNCGHIMINWS